MGQSQSTPGKVANKPINSMTTPNVLGVAPQTGGKKRNNKKTRKNRKNSK